MLPATGMLVDTWYWVSIERYWLVLGGTGSVGGGTGWYLVVLGQYRSVLIDTWRYWVNIERYWLIYDGSGLVEGSSGWCLVVMGQ